MTDIKNIIGTHMWPGEVRIDVEKVDEENVKINIDTGNVNFNSCKLPYGYNGAGSEGNRRDCGGKYYKIPYIFKSNGFKETDWYINFESTFDIVQSFDEKRKTVPFIETVEYCENFLKHLTL